MYYNKINITVLPLNYLHLEKKTNYCKRILLLKDDVLATWHWRSMPSEKELLERCRTLSLEVGQEQPNII